MCPAAAVPAGSALPPWDQPAELDRRPPYQTILAWELTLIGIHIGVPWTDEMISMCWKHPNVYTAGDAYAPRHWPASYVHYLNTYGRSPSSLTSRTARSGSITGQSVPNNTLSRP